MYDAPPYLIHWFLHTRSHDSWKNGTAGHHLSYASEHWELREDPRIKCNDIRLKQY